MKVSLNVVKQFATVDISVNDLIKKINEQLGGVENVISFEKKYKDVIIVKVVECTDHPNADRLHICKIDDGGKVQDIERDKNGLVQVVCGAPNARVGIFAAWLPPKSIVPASIHEDDVFILESRELRGIVSHGMLASMKELGLGDDHEGILEIDETDIQPGASFAEHYNLNDVIIDIENKMFTHRPDCFGQIGIAREISGIQGQAFKSPDWYLSSEPKSSVGGEELSLIVKNEALDLMPRFMAAGFKGVTIQPSPMWLQTELVQLGSKPINNIVDITNYLMLLTGQPMHAYDFDKLKGHTIIARKAKKGEKASLLNGKNYELTEEDVVIADSEGPIGLGGIMGGQTSEVSETSNNIVLECASFDMYSIRKSSMRHGLFTDAVTRFSKGQSPLQIGSVFSKAIHMIAELTGGQLASQVFDIEQIDEKYWLPIEINADFINQRLGTKLDIQEISKILSNVEFKIQNKENGNIEVTAPFWRTDIELKEDIVEEVGRLDGFDKLPLELPKKEISPVHKNKMFEKKSNLRRILAAGGANEILTYSFVPGKLIKDVCQNSELAYQIGNALSPSLQYYRLSLTPSLLDKVHPNIKAGYSDFAIYEIGKVHVKGFVNDEKVPEEFSRIALVFAADNKAEKKYNGAPYYQSLKYLDYVFDKLGIGYELLKMPEKAAVAVNEQVASPFDTKRSAVIINDKNGEFIGIIGEFKTSVKKALKLPAFCAGFEMDLDKIIEVKDRYRPLSRFPKLEQDITLKTPNDIEYSKVYKFIIDELSKIATDDVYYELMPLDIFRPENSESLHFSFRLAINSYERTLTTTEVNEMLDKISRAAEKISVSRV